MMNKENLKKIVYDHLVQQICQGTLAPNTAVVEQDLSDLLRVSRTPVREALRQLEQEGLVTHYSARGTFVKELTVQDINEIFQLRLLFELAALEKAVELITEAELDAIEKTQLSTNEHSVSEAFFYADRELHTGILRYARNTRMLRFYNILDVQIERIRRISANTPHRLQACRVEHLEILSSIRKRDLALAKKKLTLHITNVRKSALIVHDAMRVGHGAYVHS